MKNIKSIFEIALIIFIIFIAWNFINDKNPDPIIKKEVVIKTITINPPTMEVNFEFDKPKEVLYIPLPSRFDSLTRKQLIDSIVEAKTIREYKDSIVNDSLSIKVKAKVEGKLKNLFISYQLKNIKHEIEETTTTITKKTRGRVLLGLGLELGERSAIGLSGGYQNAKGNIMSLGINSNQEIRIGYSFSLFDW